MAKCSQQISRISRETRNDKEKKKKTKTLIIYSHTRDNFGKYGVCDRDIFVIKIINLDEKFYDTRAIEMPYDGKF